MKRLLQTKNCHSMSASSTPLNSMLEESHLKMRFFALPAQNDSFVKTLLHSGSEYNFLTLSNSFKADKLVDRQVYLLTLLAHYNPVFSDMYFLAFIAYSKGFAIAGSCSASTSI